MAVVVDVDMFSGITSQDGDIYVRFKTAAEDGDIERLYELIAEDPNILDYFDKAPFCETPLHIAAEKGQSYFAMELMSLKPSLARKLNTSGFSPIHLALQNSHIRTVRSFVAFDSSLVSIKGRGSITPLHHVARIGDAELLSEFLFACPLSIEDLTTKCETIVHVAVKNHQFMAFKVLLGWLKRENREDILDWKDVDGNTVYHIAASINQTEVMKLLRRIVNIKAKNLDGKTAMDILQTYKSPLFPKIRRFLNCTKEKLVCGSTITLGEYLSKHPSCFEKRNSLLGLTNMSKIRHTNFDDNRNVILVVAILIVTATYQAGFTPPGGFWQEDSKPGDLTKHRAGEMIMTIGYASFFYVFNGVAFFSSLYVIMILITGLPMWMILYCSIAALGVANFASFEQTFPWPYLETSSSLVTLIRFFGPFAHPLITGCLLLPPLVAFLINKRSKRRVDFPTRYFSSVK